MKNNDNISKKIVNYIEENQISLSEIEKYTKITKERLEDCNIVFSATEFLDLCSYLHLKPEDFR